MDPVPEIKAEEDYGPSEAKRIREYEEDSIPEAEVVADDAPPVIERMEIELHHEDSAEDSLPVLHIPEEPETSSDSRPPEIDFSLFKEEFKEEPKEEPKEEEQEVETETSAIDDELEELFAAVMTATDGIRIISTLFQLLPSKELYPDYYQYIKEPIDLKMIGTKIQNKVYLSIGDLEKDLQLMVKNAKYYNEPGSQVYKDANLLRRIIVSRKSEIEIRKPLKSERIKKRFSILHPSGQKLSVLAANLKYEDDLADGQTSAQAQLNASLPEFRRRGFDDRRSE